MSQPQAALLLAPNNTNKNASHICLCAKKKNTHHTCVDIPQGRPHVSFFLLCSQKKLRVNILIPQKMRACVIFFFYAVKYKLRVNIFVPQLRDARWTAWHDARVVCNQVWRTVAQKPLANVDAYVYVRMLCMHIILCIYIFNNVYI